jgi:hypothetical protein
MVPLALAAFVLLCFIQEVPLATTIDRDAVIETALINDAVAEGDLLVTAEEGATGSGSSASTP